MRSAYLFILIKEGDMNVVKAKELFVSGQNKVGLLEDISSAVSSADVNMRAVCAYVVEDTAFFRLITSDNEKSRQVLENLGVKVEEKDTVIAELEDKVGALNSVSKKLKQESIDLKYIYGTVSKSGDVCLLIFASSNDDKAVEVLSNA